MRVVTTLKPRHNKRWRRRLAQRAAAKRGYREPAPTLREFREYRKRRRVAELTELVEYVARFPANSRDTVVLRMLRSKRQRLRKAGLLPI